MDIGDLELSEKNENNIKSIDDYLISLRPPDDFRESSEYNAIRSLELSYQNLISVMEEAGIKNPSQLTKFEFETKIDYLQSKKTKK